MWVEVKVSFMLVKKETIGKTPHSCVFRLNPATIPAGKRTLFRWEKGQHSDSIAATIPTKKASVQ
jgi:hypothetical protein